MKTGGIDMSFRHQSLYIDWLFYSDYGYIVLKINLGWFRNDEKVMKAAIMLISFYAALLEKYFMQKVTTKYFESKSK